MKKTTKRVKAWADIGSHGGIFQFELGKIADAYPKLMHVYNYPHPGLIPVTITYELPTKPKK